MHTLITEQINKHKITITLIISLLLFIKFPPIARTLDYTAAPIDVGILSALLLATFALLLFVMLTNMLIEQYWGVLDDYAKEHFARNFKSLLHWQKVVVYLSFRSEEHTSEL